MSLVTSLQNGVQTGLKTGLMLATPIVGATALNGTAKAEELTDSFVATSAETANNTGAELARPSIEAYSNVENKQDVDKLFEKLRAGENLSVDDNLKLLNKGLGLIKDSEVVAFREKFNESTSISEILPTKFVKGLDKLINATVFNSNTDDGLQVLRPYLDHPSLYRSLQAISKLNKELIKEQLPLNQVQSSAIEFSADLKKEYIPHNGEFILVSN